MKIGMMSAWNTDSGVSIHAELIGREWLNMGHQLKIFSFIKDDFHGTAIVNEDEDFVFRCFTTSKSTSAYLNAIPFLSEDYEIFVVQDLGMLPQDELAKIFPLIKHKALTINVIHHNKLPEEARFYQFNWDAIVCFDQRYYNFLSKVFPSTLLHIIPYPCYPPTIGNKFEARKQLNLPLDKKILLLFGQRGIRDHLELFPIIEEVNKKYPLLLLVVSKRELDTIKQYKGKFPIIIREEAPNIDKLYNYLHASDLLLYHRHCPEGVVVSSTAFQCMGSGCPILALKSNYFYQMDGAVLTYTNLEEFKEKLFEIFKQGLHYQKWYKSLKQYLYENSAQSIATRYINLFNYLKNSRVVSLEGNL